MKKILCITLIGLFATQTQAQTNTGSSTASSSTSSTDTRKVRVGVFVRGTPSWYSENQNNYYSKGGAVFGLGFGLNLEFKLNEVLAFKTGIGGDFDGGKINYAFNQAAGIYTGYLLDKTPQLIEVKGQNLNSLASNVSTTNALKDRQIHTTYVTIPLVLKMMTKEINGFKYYVDFGANVGVLVGAKATDDVLQASVTTNALTTTKNSSLNMYSDCIPVRAGLNLGIGSEYRLAGTTSVFLGVNFINSFIPTLKSNSVYNFTNVDGAGNFTYAQQSAKSMGVQINIGVMF
ncbi:MAG: hypothetical protein JST67_05375 [Bacteroidetes bacterium]|nr:hypothetical protein [Bacteroidota bacterium]